MTVPEIEQRILQRNARAITAMRRAYQEQRFGLVLGAGVSRGFDFHVPDWKELIDRLASHPKVEGTKVDSAKASLSARADLLYRHYSSRVRDEIASFPSSERIDEHTAEHIAKGEWRALIRELLYAESPRPEQLCDHHPYLREYLEIIVNSPLTITYNFDSYIEMMLATRSGGGDSRGRSYETVFDGAKPFRSKSGVIYHPNGYLPQNVLERASDELVFSEEEFGDQLLASMAGYYSSLAHHLSKSTCLFVGLSLTDENLRLLLRRNAVNNPGHFHYLVDWRNPGDPPTPEREAALFDYRFKVYNLVTLPLDNEEIAALGRLLQMSYGDFQKMAKLAGVPTKYVYYLTGIPGIGKTTVLRHMASLSIYDEWMSDPLPLLAKPHSELSDDDQTLLDEWVAKQIRDKNESLLREKEGIFIVERGPLDPISFVESGMIAEKASWFRPRVVPTSFDRICDGAVVLLWGDEAKVSARIASRQTIQQPPRYLAELQGRLRTTVYKSDGVHEMHSTDWSIPELVRGVVDIVHRREYSPADINAQLLKLTK